MPNGEESLVEGNKLTKLLYIFFVLSEEKLIKIIFFLNISGFLPIMLPILGRRECEHKSQGTSIQSLVPHNIVSFLNPFQNFHVQKLNKTKTCLPFQNNYVLKSNKTQYFYFLKFCECVSLAYANLI